jgi:hypothetical protein
LLASLSNANCEVEVKHVTPLHNVATYWSAKLVLTTRTTPRLESLLFNKKEEMPCPYCPKKIKL